MDEGNRPSQATNPQGGNVATGRRRRARDLTSRRLRYRSLMLYQELYITKYYASIADLCTTKRRESRRRSRGATRQGGWPPRPPPLHRGRARAHELQANLSRIIRPSSGPLSSRDAASTARALDIHISIFRTKVSYQLIYYSTYTKKEEKPQVPDDHRAPWARVTPRVCARLPRCSRPGSYDARVSERKASECRWR